MKGIWEAIDVFKIGLLDLFSSVNCDASDKEVSWIGECDAVAIFWIWELSLIILGACGAIDLAEFSVGEFDFKRLFNYVMSVVYLR